MGRGWSAYGLPGRRRLRRFGPWLSTYWSASSVSSRRAQLPTFLRGIQTTDAQGKAEFDTRFPGWYQGRLTHIHLTLYADEQTVVTSELFFPNDVQRRIYAEDEPYTMRGQYTQTVERDGVVSSQAEKDSMTVLMSEDGDTLVAEFTIGIQR